MQEIGIELNAGPNSLSIKDYSLELENNLIKRVCIFVKNGIEKIRRSELKLKSG